MSQIIDLPMMRLETELRAETFNESEFTMDCCWTTGATGRRVSWSEGAYDEELIVTPNAVRLARLNAGAALLDAHAGYSCNAVIGCVVPGSARIANGIGTAQVQLSRAAGVADTVQKIREKSIRNMSVGYVRHTIEKTERDGAVPLWRVTDWEPFELSAVPIGFDAGAQFRSLPDRQEALYPCRIVGASAVEIARARLRMRARGLAAVA